ncbi:lysoplasmalogenase family protein [Galbibacter sp. EGI 63066]|uniref:lysoplasmalogenase family protein n=1 Tax=Galbibacter sp. EGI 63066 TaxID=2993559 RepID=UPI002248E62C|nr:lysoplasmalogenase family protein [Galbibacter sp. EGI 63066]MCX2680041.1 lysoplasmalogenase family protein [Galbibacter sp. EGI 63066]
MNKEQLLKIYFVFGAVYLLAVLFDLRLLTNIAKLSLVPLVFLSYYIFNKKCELIPIIIMGCCFLGDAFSLYPYNMIKISFVFFAISHLIFAYICFRSIKDLKVKKLIFSAVPVIILWFVYFNYSIKDIFGDQMGDLYSFVIVYSVVLSTFTILSLVNYFNNEIKVNLYPIIIALCFLVRDIIMAINSYITDLIFFSATMVVAKVVGYYFLLRFVTTFDFKRLNGRLY